MAQLTEEVGEVARMYAVMANNPKKKVIKKDLGEELADVVL
jgi:NTP pyrophosphatase (non-canonical NTP hydrolase)